MNKRMRKKRHLGEFNTIDLDIEAKIANLNDEWFDKLFDYLSSINLFGGGGDSSTGEVGFGICKYLNHKPVSITKSDKDDVVDWFTKNGATDIKIEYVLGWGHRRKPAKHELAKHGLL